MSFCMCVRRAISAFPTELWFYSYYYDKLEDAVVSGAAPILAALVVPLAILTWFLFQQCFIETELLSDEFSSQQLGQWSCSQISRFLCRVTQNFAHHFLKCALANSLYAKCKHPLLPCASPWLNIEYDVLPTTCGIPPHSLLTCPLVTIQQLGKNCAWKYSKAAYAGFVKSCTLVLTYFEWKKITHNQIQRFLEHHI